MAFKITVLGSSGGYPGPGRACSGYLLQNGEGNIVLDLGAGALANLLKYIPPDDVDGLALTHMHYDHYVDIYGLCTARRFWEASVTPLPLLAPPHAPDVIANPLQESSRDKFMLSLEVRGLFPEVRDNIAGFEIAALPAEHKVIDSLIYRVAFAGKTVCYSGDTDLCEALLEQARGADLFICEATYTSQVREKMRGHLFAREAGRVAADAGVGRLLLTHIWPTLSVDRALDDARSVFDGRVQVAIEDLIIDM